MDEMTKMNGKYFFFVGDVPPKAAELNTNTANLIRQPEADGNTDKRNKCRY